MSVRINIFYNEPKCLHIETEYQTTHSKVIVRSNQGRLQLIKSNFNLMHHLSKGFEVWSPLILI